MVRLLTPLAPMIRFALLGKMISSKTIHAKAMVTQCGQLLLMRESFELRAGIEWMLVHLAYNALIGTDVCCERVDRFEWWILPGRFHLVLG